MQATGVEAMAHSCDIADEAALEHFLDQVRERFGSVDILICNASAMGVGADRGGWRRSIGLDLLSSVQAVQQVTPWMQQAGSGSIILLSSIAALRGAGAPTYVTAKAALISYAKAMAVKQAGTPWHPRQLLGSGLDRVSWWSMG
ncbi:SDR family oxidoreductase [Halopseudomonas sp. Lyrl_26]|uniref:SDR family NAD(P)-dependent oxidoreductase n=1 Tax=Halopseudomonas sp. Lyrl_26 TaxID=3110923 RepID=UPI003F7E2FC1